MSDQPDVTPRDALQVAQRALQKANRVDDVEAELEDVEYRLTKLEMRLSEIDDSRPYSALTLDEKIGMVREHAYVRAKDGRGSSKLDYNDVMWEVFDGEPGEKHCYKLIRKAAEARGFEQRNPPSRNKHLHCDAREAEKGVAFFPENKAARDGGRVE